MFPLGIVNKHLMLKVIVVKLDTCSHTL